MKTGSDLRWEEQRKVAREQLLFLWLCAVVILFLKLSAGFLTAATSAAPFRVTGTIESLKSGGIPKGYFELKSASHEWQITVQQGSNRTDLHYDGTNLCLVYDYTHGRIGRIANQALPEFGAAFMGRIHPQLLWLSFFSDGYVGRTNWMYVPWWNPALEGSASYSFAVESRLATGNGPSNLVFRSSSAFHKREIVLRQSQMKLKRWLEWSTFPFPDGVLAARYSARAITNWAGSHLPIEFEFVRYRITPTDSEPVGTELEHYFGRVTNIEPMSATSLTLDLTGVSFVEDFRFADTKRPDFWFRVEKPTKWTGTNDPALLALAYAARERYDQRKRAETLKRVGPAIVGPILFLALVGVLWRRMKR